MVLSGMLMSVFSSISVYRVSTVSAFCGSLGLFLIMGSDVGTNLVKVFIFLGVIGFSGGLNPFYFILMERSPKQITTGSAEISLSLAYMVSALVPFVTDLDGRGPLIVAMVLSVVPFIVSM